MKRDWSIYWTFDTADYQIVFDVTEDDDLDLSWDESGETRDGLASGKYVAFVARVRVIHKPTECELGCETLSSCIYNSVNHFRHKSMYFHDMVRTACLDAREHAKAYLGIAKVAA